MKTGAKIITDLIEPEKSFDFHSNSNRKTLKGLKNQL